jgi:hypothetical protein
LFEVTTQNIDYAFEERGPDGAKIFNFKEIMHLNVTEAQPLIEGIGLYPGANLIVAAPKCGKTLTVAQFSISLATGEALYGQFRVLRPGPVLIVAQDDPAGAASTKQILQRSRVPLDDNTPLYVAPKAPFEFGGDFINWLGETISRLSLRAAFLDSYTALRPSRSKGGDIVKEEQKDLTMLDGLGKQTDCALGIVHHVSKGSSGLDWTQGAAGTFAMSAATESQLHISRFMDLDNAAPERLVRIRGRHSEDLEIVIRFRKESLDFDYVMEGGAAALYPVLLQLETAFGTQSFTPKELAASTGWSRATAHRNIDRLTRAGSLQKRSYGSYELASR